jgi:2',3'-cyclic-nucleotide 2'-phosphodiesterase (5'-nucleotidase family)
LALEVVDGVEIDEVEFEITGGDMEPMGGTIDTSAPGATASVEVFGLPPGDGYTVTMAATTVDGEITCEGSEDFGVVAGVATDVMVILNCKRPPSLGAVRANGKFNTCAQLTKTIVAPLVTGVGESIEVSAEAYDAEVDEIEYAWTATAGSFTSDSDAATTYTCDVEGSQSVRVTVSDDGFEYCKDSWTVNVTCGDPAAGPSNRLQLIHSSDNESSFQDPNTLEEKILGYAAAVDGLQTLADQESITSVHLTAGDHTIPGPFYQASGEVEGLGEPGLGDIEMYNAMSVAANGMGNHEFDGGIDEFAEMLATSAYPFLAVNLDFSEVEVMDGTPQIVIGEDGSDCEDNAAKVLKSCVLEVDGQRLGLIGRAPSEFFRVTCVPDEAGDPCPGLDFVGGRDDTDQPLVPAVEQVLAQVALLEDKGIDKIILLNHAQSFDSDEISLGELRGVDIIVEAGATGFQSQAEADGPFNFLRPEDQGSAGEVPYPLVLEDSEGSTVLTINSEQLYRYVGQLIVTWDAEGKIFSVDERSGPIATTAEAIGLLEDEIGEPAVAPEEVEEVFASLQATPLITDAFAEVGETAFPLNGLRADVRTRETNLGRVAADSTLWFAQQDFPELDVDIGFKNGGGIRDSITGPTIIRLTIQAALAFNNKLTVLRLDATQLLAAMENSVSRFPSADGRFPQVAGLTMEYDSSKPGVEGLATLDTPSRVRRLVVTRVDGTEDVLVDNFTIQGDLSRTFVLATNSFLTGGGDGYASFLEAEALAETQIGEQLILEQYIADELGGFVNVDDPPPSPRVTNIAP